MADSIGGGKVVANIVLIMLFLATLLAIMTLMSGASRTLYQASVDGWLPKYLGCTNEHGAPTAAMWTDRSFKLLLALLILPVFCYRHYVQDKGRFPQAMLSDLYIQADAGQKRAGWLPYVTLISVVLVVCGCHQLVA
ncbi:amino acid permease [Pseudomonas sp. BF-R-19]|uniref:amino acid permease n=1 Tax=Pseudomonas sp. BF-R-19 TaxID=2832397 RepID=UPI001CC19D70